MLFGHRGDEFVFALETGFELLNLLCLQFSSTGAGRAIKSRRSVLKESLLPLLEECGMDLVLVAYGRDRLAINQMEFEQPDFLLGGTLAARVGGLVFFWIHGRVNCPAIACLIVSIRTFRRGAGQNIEIHRVDYSRIRNTFAGTPPTIAFFGTSLTTSDRAATTAPSPIVTPLSTVTPWPIHTLSPITMGPRVSFGCSR